MHNTRILTRLMAVTALTASPVAASFGQEAPISRLCTPIVDHLVTVAGPASRTTAGQQAQPPLTDIFAWPDTPVGVVRTGIGLRFFASDGGDHKRQIFNGHSVGDNKSGSITTTSGTFDDPLGTDPPLDVSVSPNPDRNVDPNYSSYGYIGGGPVYQVPANMPGAGSLLATYHAELPNDALYPVLGLASSHDGGLHWTDLGEILRFNQAYAQGLDGVEIGDGPLVPSPDGKYFYLYFPDWIANGTRHATTLTHVSVARAPITDVLRDAFETTPTHSASFQKFYDGQWDLQPAVGGASTDLAPNSPFEGYLDVHYDSALQRYVMLISNDTEFGYAESIDALHWTKPMSLGEFGPIAAYPTAVGMGENPQILGSVFYLFFTYLPPDGSGWAHGAMKRLTLTCAAR